MRSVCSFSPSKQKQDVRASFESSNTVAERAMDGYLITKKF